jgi:hypothetical protein
LFFLIDTPQSRWLSLTEEEKEIVKLRTQDNAVVRKGKVNQAQYIEALKEPRLWLIFISAMVNNFQNGGLIHFSNVLVKSLGFNTLDTILLQIPSGFVSALFVFGGVMLHRKTGQLCYSVMVLSTISGIGCLLLAVLPQNGIKLLAFYLSWPCTGAYTLIVTLISSTVSGYSKKIFYNGILMIAYTLGNFIGPLVILDNEAPAYKSAMWVYFTANVLVCVCFVLMRVWLSRLNVKKAPGRTNEPTDVNLNLTDREDPNYVYKF